MSAVISDQQSNPSVAEFFSPGPGERLRAARLSMGLDLAKIASELHLTSSVVERLEADEYDGIGARVFVRGYLRNYARIVEMPVESILRQFDEKWPDDPSGRSMLRESPRLPADGGPSRGWAGAFSWLLVIGVLALFLMWWRGYLDGLVPGQGGSTTTQAPLEDAGLSVGDTAVDLPSDMVPLDSAGGGLRLPSLLNDVGSPEARLDTFDTMPEPSAGPATSASVSEQAAPEDGGATTREPTETPDPGWVSPLASVTAAGGAAGAPEAAVGTAATADIETGGAPVVEATTGIVMTFSGPCWVDVRDSTRKFKLFGEMPKGARKVLGGEPPYQMVIGNAQAVSIEVNGKPFDIAEYARGNVARFTLSP